MKANSAGDLFTENVLRSAVFHVTGTNQVTIAPTQYHFDGCAFQLITEAATRTITHDADDSVVALTGTWRFDNGAFTAQDVGATFTVSGAANPGNNGTFTILTVVDGTHVTTATTGLVDETFGAGVTVTLSGGVALQGAWTCDVSLDYVDAHLPGLNQLANAGHWAPVSTKFANTGSPFFPAIAAVTTASNQYLQMYPFVGRAVRWTFTPSTGQGNITILYAAKGNR